MQGDDVSELGSTASCSSWEHSANGHCHGNRHRGLTHQQLQVDDVGSSRSGAVSLSTVQSECSTGNIFPFCDTTSPEMSVAMSDKTDRDSHRRSKRNGRHGRSDMSSAAVPAVESIHFEGHLLHRVCGVTGKFPTRGDGGGGTNSHGDDGNGSDESSLLEDSGENQLARLRRNPRMMDILSRLKAVSLSLIGRDGHETDSGPSHQNENQHQNQDRKGQVAIGGRRIEVVRLAQEEYLRLFEEMLGELLKIQREKSKVTPTTPRTYHTIASDRSGMASGLNQNVPSTCLVKQPVEAWNGICRGVPVV